MAHVVQRSERTRRYHLSLSPELAQRLWRMGKANRLPPDDQVRVILAKLCRFDPGEVSPVPPARYPAIEVDKYGFVRVILMCTMAEDGRIQETARKKEFEPTEYVLAMLQRWVPKDAR